jgi:CMP/dCMP kinase
MSEPNAKVVIAIDGPAGAGKSTIASRLARKLGYVNIESGAMYRALGLKAIENDVDVDDPTALLRLAHESHIVLEPQIDGNRVMLDGANVSGRIRERDVTDAASRVSVHPPVRQWMVALQREMGKNGGVVMEGRDIGTAVFPDAEIKVFLDATPEVRAERRLNQAGVTDDPGRAKAIVADLQSRDQRDRTRKTSPLVAADGAIIIDSSKLSIDEVVARILEAVTRHTQAR